MLDQSNNGYASARAVAVACLLALSLNVQGQSEASPETDGDATENIPDTSGWACADCPFSYGLTGSILFGAGYVSDDFHDFGNFGGLDDDGVFGAFGADLLYRTEDGHHLSIFGERLGLDSRTLSIEGGRQGSYKLWLRYDEIPHARLQNTQTIFDGAGTANQELPPDWVRAGTTDGMTALDASLRDIDIGHDRETVGLGFLIGSESPWRYRADVQRETRDGERLQGASFIFRASELAAPVDYETTRLDAAIGYVRDLWELELSYDLSIFDNRNRSLRWQNPFLGINGADTGEISQAPDNQFHQVMLSGSWRQSRWLSLAGQVAFGRMDQDEQFLATSLNPNFSGIGLPRSNLDGEVNTRIVNLRATSKITRRMNANVRFKYDERDDDTPRDAFTQVVSDTFLTEAQINEPVSYERTGIKGELDYRLFSFLKLTASAEHKSMERKFQEVEDTDTEIYSFQARATPFSRLSINLEATREDRDNDLDPSLLGPQVNPGLRRFHFAEKERDFLRLNVDYAILDNLFAGVYVELADEDYQDVQIGLSDATSESYGLDLSATFSEHITAYAFVALETLEADISGADNINGAPWEARQDDEFRTVGLGVNFNELPGKWVQANLDIAYNSADGDIRIDKFGVDAPEFPELETTRFTLDAWIERALRKNMNLRIGYLFGKLTEDDFFHDNVAPNTVPTLLSLGQRTPGQTVHVISAMLRYQFQ
ncbi:MAG: MtrB/PioB family decaheme-associated outer membrane protein [Wenzhouxiangellaceae bacterium]|nr:MtrB/PioB family decaheme-associated outer membrane protein [Wenzhouxiangellaceae bacterium]